MVNTNDSVRKTRRTYNIPRHTHALTFSCHRREPLLSDDRTKRLLIESIDESRRRHDFALIAYVVMPEHVHLVVLPRKLEYEIATILKSIKQPVAQRIAAWWRDHDPAAAAAHLVARPSGRQEIRFWQQGGGFDRNLWSDDAIRKTVEYIHANPVRRGLVQRPTDWKWSSARCYEQQGDVALAVERMP